MSADAVHQAIKQVALQINQDYADCECPLLMITLNGGIVFGTELFRQIEGNCEVGFVKFSSYKNELYSSGKATLEIPPTIDVKGRDVILAEDIVDTGNTLVELMRIFTEAGAASVRIATLLIKREVYDKQYAIDYVGLESEDLFVVGCGLDYAGLGRNLNGIYKIIEE